MASSRYEDDYYLCVFHNFPIPPIFNEGGWRLIHNDAGTLCQLDRNNGWQVWMGNGPDEMSDMAYGAARMRGRCLVLGLGIGLVVQMIDLIGKVTHITVVEKDQIVIRNIGPWLKSIIRTPIEIIQGDDEAYIENTGQVFDTMYVDTWEKCTDAVEKIDRLKIASKRCVKGKKVYWAEKELRHKRDIESNN